MLHIIEMDELNEVNIPAAAEKSDKLWCVELRYATLGHKTQQNKKHILIGNVINYHAFKALI